MNEMYNMSIVTHYYGVLAVLGAILLNLFMLIKANDIQKYKKFNTLFNPINGTFLGIVIFTGIVMMAAKHLNFTVENIIMILIAIYIIVLELKRNKALKIIKDDFHSSFQFYKFFAIRMLITQLLLLIAISIWMLV
ncbi:MAG: hypothetical protein COB17_00685 [Sulfurimonas sp.]|nr:MAG: hypothetical protein COB17_00685 [Sulfurimonas sp.]